MRATAVSARLDAIEESNDWLALATAKEFEIWTDASEVEDRPSVSAPIPEASDVRDKLTC